MKVVIHILIVFGALLIFQFAFGSTFAELEVAFDSGFQNPTYRIRDDEADQIKIRIDNFQDKYERGEFVEPLQIRDITLALFKDGRPQEGIWVLDRLGLISEAEWFSHKLEQSLMSGPITMTTKIGNGVSGSKWGKVGNFPVVVKPPECYWDCTREAEIWTYHLDRILGLNLVTVAVSAKIAGIEYSIHPALQQVWDSGLNFLWKGYKEEYPEIFVLDYLTRNVDRHGHNSLMSPFGFLVAIDNGRATAMRFNQDMGIQLWLKNPSYPFSKFPRKDIVNTIAAIDIQEFKHEFAKFTTPDVVDFVADRLAILKNDFTAIATFTNVRPLDREGRLGQRQIDVKRIQDLRQSAVQKSEERKRAFVEALEAELSILYDRIPTLPADVNLQYNRVNGLDLSDNGHAIREFISNYKSRLTPKMINTFMETLVLLKDQRKMGERDLRHLVAYLVSLSPIELVNITHFVHQMEIDRTFREIIDREAFHEDFKEYLIRSQQGIENLNKLMEWIPQLRNQGLTCRYLLRNIF